MGLCRAAFVPVVKMPYSMPDMARLFSTQTQGPSDEMIGRLLITVPGG